MSTLLDRLLGTRKSTASATIQAEIDKQTAVLNDAKARIVAADKAAADAVDRVALRAANSARLDATDDVTLAERALVELRQEFDNRLASEARNALEARTEAAKRRVAVDALKVLDQYERAAAGVAKAIENLSEIEAEVNAVNAERLKARLPIISGVDDIHRKASDRHIPERREMQAKWFLPNSDEEVVLYDSSNGERIPKDGRGVRRVVEVVVQRERTIRGAELPSLTANVVLPPARIGAERHWPKDGE